MSKPTLLETAGRMSVSIRPKLRLLLSIEDKKNKLINDLLESHYKNNGRL